MAGEGLPSDPRRPAPADGIGAGGPWCPNCGGGQVATYCAACGERQPSHADYTLRHMAGEAYAEFVNVDGRLWRSVVALLSKPGLLTREYFAGRRGRYMRPFSLFVLLNLAFFVVQPYTNLLNYDYAAYVNGDPVATARVEARRRELFLPQRRFIQRFDDEARNEKRSLLLVAIPVFALALLVLYALSGRTYVEHLVFSIHVYAFLLFFLTALGTLWFAILRLVRDHVPWLASTARFLGRSLGVELVLVIAMLVYFTLALRRYYGSRAVPALARAVVLVAVFALLLSRFQQAMFYTTLWAMG